MSSTEDDGEQLLQDTAKFEACCAGLTPVLEAVDELPASGLPIPASAQSRVRQFFVEQVSSAPAAGRSASPGTGSPGSPAGSRSLYVRPKGLQDTKQLQEHVKAVLVLGFGQDIPANLTPLMSAAISLVADAAHQVARQQVIEKNSSAYGVLLDEGYRAGVLARCCAMLRATLDLRIITDLQLARVMAVACSASSQAVNPGPLVDFAKVSGFAWRHLKAYYCSSGSSPPVWALMGDTAGFWLLSAMQDTVTCFKPAALPPGLEVCRICSPGDLFGSSELADKGPAAGMAAPVAGMSPLISRALCGSCGKPSCPCCSMQVAAAGSPGKHASGSKASSSAAGAGASGAAAGKSSAGLGSGPAEGGIDMSLPLDDCPLLAAQCVGLTPLLAAVEAWVQAGSGDTAALRAAIKAYVAGQAASCSSGGGGAGSGGSAVAAFAEEGGGSSLRRTIVPAYYRNSNNTLQGVKTVLEMSLLLLFMDKQAAAHCAALPELVLGVLREVAREQIVEKGSAAYEALCCAGCMAGGVVLGCSVLSRGLSITINTEQQLLQAVKACCEARRSAMDGTSIRDAATTTSLQRSVAFNAYQVLQQITAPSTRSSGDGGSSGAGGGSSNTSAGGDGSSSKFSMPPCSLDDAYVYVGGFEGCLATMWETRGAVTAAEARARKAKAPNLSNDQLVMLNAIKGMASAAAGMAIVQGAEAAGGSTASSSEQEAAWGKGSALAGLKGLFQRGAASIQKGTASIQKGTASKAAAPAATPVAVQTSSSGAVVASTASKQRAAPAAAAAANAGGKPGKAGGQPGKAAAAAASSSSSGDPSSSGATTTTKASSSSSSSTPGTAKAQSTPAGLLDPGNLKTWFWSPETFERPPGRADCVKVLPQDALQALVQLKLHTTHCSTFGWNALHYACAAQRIELVEQLIHAGAPVSEPEHTLGLQPLHLACIGGITTFEEFYELTLCTAIDSMREFVRTRDAFSADLVALLLRHGADPDAFAEIGERVDSGAWVTPLHILTFYTGGTPTGTNKGRLAQLVFSNPFVGKAVAMCAAARTGGPTAVGLHYAHLDLHSASLGALSIRSPEGVLETHYHPEIGDDDVESPAHESLPVGAVLAYDSSVATGIARLRACEMLLRKGADVDAIAEPTGDTPLMTAAFCGNAAVMDVLLRAGADPEQERYDGARALEIAASRGHCAAGWTLMCHGAVAVPHWMRAGKDPPRRDPAAVEKQLVPEMLVSHATQCDASPWNILFLDRLLAEWPDLEGVWQETGETPLLAAVTYNDNEMVRRLLMAGADVNATLEGTDTPALAQALYKGGRDDDTQDIVQTLIDAGAEIHSWQSSSTEYDMLQTAANESNLEASLKLVEAGAKWQTPKQERVRGVTVYYPPEILAITVPGLKVNFVETRFRLAEKTGRGKRAAAAAALQRWLGPDVSPECKEATLRALCRALDGRDHITMQHSTSRPLLGAPSLGSTPAAAAGPPKGCKTLPGVQQRVQAGSTGGPKGGGAAARPAADPNDIDAVLAEIESVSASGASAAAGMGSSSGSKAASKKKKKETAAQKEARRKQQQRLQRLQQQEQEQGSESGSDSEAAAAATTTAEAEVASSTAGGPASASLDAGQLAEAILAEAMQQSTQQAALFTNSQAHSLEQQQAAAGQPQQQQHKQKSKKGKAAKQQQQQEEEPQQQPAGLRTPTPASLQQPAAPAAAAAAASPKRPAHMAPPAAAAAASTKASAAAASAAAPAAAAPSAPPPAGGTSPQPVTAARAAFLPPHLRMSMPGLAAPAPPAAAPPAAAAALQPQQQHQQPPPQQQRVSGLQARMVELAQQHQLQQQQAAAPPPQQQQQGPAKGSAPVLPELPSAMMAFLSGAAQRQAPAGTTAGHAGSSQQQQQAPHPMDGKRQQQGLGAAAARAATGARASPTAGAQTAGAAAPKAAGKGPKPCVVCAQRRRNVLLTPCNHILLCEACAEQLAGKGALGSCPTCHKPVKQRIRVHQS